MDNPDGKNTFLNSPVYFLGHQLLPPDYHYWCHLRLCCCSAWSLSEWLLTAILAQTQSHQQWVLRHLASYQAVFISWQNRAFQSFGRISKQSGRGVLGLFINFSGGGRVAEYRGGSPVFNECIWGGHSLFRQSIGGGGSWVVSTIRIRKSADLIPDADIFFIIAVNSFMVQYRKQLYASTCSKWHIIHIFESLQILLHVIQDVQHKPLVSIAVNHLPVKFGQFQEGVHVYVVCHEWLRQVQVIFRINV